MAVQWRRTQPAMGFFLEASGTLEAFAAATPVRFGPLRRWIRNERRALTRETREVLRLARRRLPARATVITISRSSLVRDALGGLPAGRRPALVLALRSRPGGEGVQLARELHERAVRAMVVEDGSLGRLTQPIQLVLLGADALLPGGDLVHKVGTCPLARWARRRGIPVIVLAGRSKFVRALPEALRLPSRFDRTPAAYITEVWSDDPGSTVARPGERGRRPPQKRTRP
ncbi:MAG TPA: hypothetical protein VFG07_10360 [Thermoplasmata archaeon]|nr:hypothetical protein [Thermoplasmata archaeon]